MRLPFRKTTEPIDLLITNDFGAKLKAAPDPLHVEVYAAITAAQDCLRSGGRTRLVAMHEGKHPLYAIDHERYTIMVLHMDGKYVVTGMMRLEIRPVFPEEHDFTPSLDDRCSSCERWSGHPHAEWCSTRHEGSVFPSTDTPPLNCFAVQCTCPDSNTGHLEGCPNA